MGTIFQVPVINLFWMRLNLSERSEIKVLLDSLLPFKAKVAILAQSLLPDFLALKFPIVLEPEVVHIYTFLT